MYCVDVVDGVLPLLELFLLAFVCLFELEGLDRPDLGLGVVLGDDGAFTLGESLDKNLFVSSSDGAYGFLLLLDFVFLFALAQLEPKGLSQTIVLLEVSWILPCFRALVYLLVFISNHEGFLKNDYFGYWLSFFFRSRLKNDMDN